MNNTDTLIGKVVKVDLWIGENSFVKVVGELEIDNDLYSVTDNNSKLLFTEEQIAHFSVYEQHQISFFRYKGYIRLHNPVYNTGVYNS